MGSYGQDWSSYQAAQPDTTGLAFAFVKVTEGLSYTNPKWQAQRDHAKAHGLVWGAYHYPHMANSPEAEADYFLSKIAWQPGDLIVLDWEGYDAANKGVSRARQRQYKDQWLAYVRARMPGHRVGTYMNVDYWANGAAGPVGDFLWIATANRPAGSPGITSSWLFHQYSAATVDRDFCPLGKAELQAWALGVAQADIEEDDMPTAEQIAEAVWNYPVPIPRRQADGSIKYEPGKQGALWPLVWGNVWSAEAQQRDAALQGAISGLAGLLSAQHTNLTAEQITEAVRKGIQDGLVHVQVDVNTPPVTH
jgi:hypothetical protein